MPDAPPSPLVQIGYVLIADGALLLLAKYAEHLSSHFLIQIGQRLLLECLIFFLIPDVSCFPDMTQNAGLGSRRQIAEPLSPHSTQLALPQEKGQAIQFTPPLGQRLAVEPGQSLLVHEVARLFQILLQAALKVIFQVGHPLLANLLLQLATQVIHNLLVDLRGQVSQPHLSVLALPGLVHKILRLVKVLPEQVLDLPLQVRDGPIIASGQQVLSKIASDSLADLLLHPRSRHTRKLLDFGPGHEVVPLIQVVPDA